VKPEFYHASESFKRLNPHLFVSHGVAQHAEQKPNPGDEPVATDAREGVDTAKRRVCITSFRLRMLDTRNLWDHFFTDALVIGGILFDDSPQYAEIEVNQVIVKDKAEVRTEIVVNALMSAKDQNT